MSNFRPFGDAVRARFAEMASEPLFAVAADGDEIWAKYLGAFPPGADPLFRKRTEHDCSCCRHFIRSVGAVVAIQNGALASIWDLTGMPAPYQDVADAMAAYVKSLPIRDVFVTKFAEHGAAVTRSLAVGGGTMTWDHFMVEVPPAHVADNCDERRGDARTTHAVLMRGIRELSAEAVDVVVELIRAGTLYRGQEHLAAAGEFQRLQARVLTAPDERSAEILAWAAIKSHAARFRNTVVGTLVQDLSAGADLEAAVRAYEVKVAPQNYKRPTALITKKMVEDAMAAICELGLEGALARRHARLEDVSVTSVLFVDNAVRGRMRGGVEDLLMEEVRPAEFDPSRAEVIGVDKFVAEVLPGAKSVQLFLDNAKLGNFVSLTAPAHAGAGGLFRWGNDFAWSYAGNAADSIKERVKRAGGRVEGVALRVSLAWSNFDDLDIHVREPSGNEIAYFNKSGKLDVDMNAGLGRTREPVENVRWVGALRDGAYQVWVNQYSKRESTGVGFEVEVEHGGGFETFRYEQAVRSLANVVVAQIIVKNGRAVEVRPSDQVVGGAAAREQWGLTTQRLVRANAIDRGPC